MSSELNWKPYERQAPKWFRDAKFGLFFHWGPYSVPAFENEWYSRNMYGKGLSQNVHHEKTYGPLHDFGYKDFYPMFTGEKFDPEEWADLVVASGAKYAGPVTEHADNFSMWNSQVNPVNAVHYGPKRDITGECVDAFRKRNIKILSTFHHQWLWGWFMSSDAEADVYNPDNEQYYWDALPLETNRYHPYRMPDEKFNQMWLDKVNEVVDLYQPDLIYFDSRSFIIDEAYRYKMVSHYYDTCSSKDIAISYKQEDFPSDIGIYDIECGRFSQSKNFPWQTDDRLEDNITWCMVQNPKYKSACSIIHQLCDITAKNGNLLLNVGPNADGSFHPDAVSILHEIGDWLKVNGEAIYNTRPWLTAAEGPTTVADENYDIDKINHQVEDGLASDIRNHIFTSEDFRFTQNDSAVYAITFGWPENRKLYIKTLKKCSPRAVSKVQLLGTDFGLDFIQTKDFLEVTLPDQPPCKHAYALKILF